MSFQYASRPDKFALRNASFFFPAGETTFIVGRSGSGKSTLSSLLMRFYDATSGNITIDGHSIQALHTEWLRNNITLIQQQNVLFNETIFKNIAFGARDHLTVKHSDFQVSIETAGLQDTFHGAPEGLDTSVGAGGISLSGGQKQRIAIARSRLRDTPILIMDEATGALDQTSKKMVMESIRKWRHGKTTIVVTHDVSQILPDNYTYVLDGGRIIQEGYKSALERSNSGPFADLTRSKIAVSPVRDLESQEGLARTSVQEPSSYISNGLATLPEDTPMSRAGSLISSDFPSQPKTRRPSQGFALPSAPVAVHINRISNKNMSMIPIKTFSGSDLAQLTSNGKVSRHGSIDSSITLPSTRRPSSGSASISDPNRKPPRLKPKSVQRETEHNEQPRHLASIQAILFTVWPNLEWQNQVRLVLGFVCAFVHAAATPLFSWVFSQLLSTFFLPEDRSAMALRWSLSVLGIAVGDALASYFMHYLLESCGQAWVDSLRIQAMARLLDQPKSWFEQEGHSCSSLVDSLDRNAEEMRNLLGRFAGFIFVAVVMLVIAFMSSLIISWKLTLVAVASAPFMYGVTRGFESISGKWEANSNDAGEAASLVFAETFENIKTVRALTLEGYFHEKHLKTTAKALKTGLKRAAYSGLFFGLSDAGIIYITGKGLHQLEDFLLKILLMLCSTNILLWFLVGLVSSN